MSQQTAPATEQRVIAVISDSRPRSNRDQPISAETSLSSLGLDSLAIVALVFRLERELQVDFSQHHLVTELGKMKTVADVIAASQSVLGARNVEVRQ
jgi:acyl carrier protein